MYADCGDFFASHPNTFIAFFWNPLRGNAKNSQRVDQTALDAIEIRMDVAFPFSQIENRIANKLAGAVIGNVAPAIGFEIIDAGSAPDFRAGKTLCSLPLRPIVTTCGCSTKSSVSTPSPRLRSVHQLELAGERIGITHAAQIQNFEGA